ncbi:hypothetical protein FOL47_010841 [Perkinsus chesapeaki]|uniref:C3H1-type domain-containing protein n=1 Tax=Perkinsus chesapeaki TaxID=330153 RepID=A0A7J6MPS8_PERCH|nr:hypothetical protein FOL47_010841 [Perkinsus chesapeaki]
MCRACDRSRQLRLQLDTSATTAPAKSRSPSVASDCSSIDQSSKSSPADRATVASSPNSAESPQLRSPQGPTAQVTRPLCAYFKNDRCRMGNACRFAHSLKEHKNPRLILMRRFPQYQQTNQTYVAPQAVAAPKVYGYMAPAPAALVQQQQQEVRMYSVPVPNGGMAVQPAQMYYYYQTAAAPATPAAPMGQQIYYAPAMMTSNNEHTSKLPQTSAVSDAQ